MNLIDIYNNSLNPIDDKATMKKLLEAYSNLNGHSFYSKLVDFTVKDKIHGRYNVYYSDKLFSTLFNKWKNSIVSMTRPEFIDLYLNGSYGQDLVVLRKFLKTVEDVKTQKEANEIMYHKYDDEVLNEAMDKYRYTAFGEGSGWEHINSKYLTAKKDKHPNIEHRLYLNTNSTDTHELLCYFIEKCDKYKIPYYYKFDFEGRRDDTIVIYSDTERLKDYIKILREIKQEHEELIGRCKNPPILTAKIDGWIGYGSEPDRTKEGKLQSFNGVRSPLIYSAIDNKTKDWIYNHKDIQISYGNIKQSFQDFLIDKIIDEVYNNLEYDYNFFHKVWKDRSEKEIEKQIGFTKEDLSSKEIKNYIYKYVRNYINGNMDIIFKEKKKVEPLKIPTKYNKNIKVNNDMIQNIIGKIALEINKSDSSFIPSIIKEIKEKSPKVGVDPNNISFDIKARNKLFEYDKNNKSEKIVENNINQEQVVNQKPVIQDDKKNVVTKIPEDKKPQPVVQKPDDKKLPAIIKEPINQTSVDNTQNNKVDLENMLDEYIPGTNIRKPRYRKVNETDEEYEKFLEEYYSKYFTEEQMGRKK